MAFKKIDKTALPPRQWALVGYPSGGKSTFAAQMTGPILVIDADHRFAEVARLTAGEIFTLSDEPSDSVSAERIAALLKENMTGSGVKTIVIDSLTSILSPLVVSAIMGNDAGSNKNRVASFKPKSMAMRLLQDTITGWGVNTLWIYHTRSSLDGQAREVENTSISVVELARLRRSLNLQLEIVEKNGKRGITIKWARCGRAGMTLWDDTDFWRGMPEKIEAEVYGGLTAEDMNRIAGSTPTSFSGQEEALAWGFEQGCFRDAVHAKNAYDKCKAEQKPKTSADMWRLWIEDVTERKKAGTTEGEEEEEQPAINQATNEGDIAVLAATVNATIAATEPSDEAAASIQPPTIWDTVSDIFGATLDPTSRQQFTIWLITAYTKNRTPANIRASEGELDGAEINTIIKQLNTSSSGYLQKFIAAQKEISEAVAAAEQAKAAKPVAKPKTKPAAEPVAEAA